MHIFDYAGAQAIDSSTICPKVDPLKPHMFGKVFSGSREQGGGGAFSTILSGRAVSGDITIYGIRIANPLGLAHALKEIDRLRLFPGGPKHKMYSQEPSKSVSVDAGANFSPPPVSSNTPFIH